MAMLLDEERGARQMAVGMQCAIAGAAASKVLRQVDLTDKEKRACDGIAELLGAVSRGQEFLIETSTSPKTASLDDFQQCSTLGLAFENWTRRSESEGARPFGAFLQKQAKALSGIGNASREDVEQVRDFMRFLSDALEQSLACDGAFTEVDDVSDVDVP